MPEYLKALPVVLLLSGLAFAAVKPHLQAVPMAAADFERRRNLWIAITLIAFLAHNFWLYMLAVAGLLLAFQRLEANPLALFLFVLFAVPPVAGEVSGMGLVNTLVSVDYLRLLTLVVLLPAALAIRRGGAIPFGRTAPDKFLLAYVLLLFVLRLNADTFTNSLRNGCYSLVDIVLPYYVASRLARDLSALREALAAFVTAAMALALIAVFELARHWLLYASLPQALGVEWKLGGYFMRGESLRAVASTGQAIALGYVMSVALPLYLAFKPRLAPLVWCCGLLVLLAGLIAPISRGPWMGAAAAIAVLAVTGRRPASQLLVLLGAVALALPPLLVTPLGDTIVEHLPFVGSVDVGTVSYRQQLFDVAIKVIHENLWFGALDYLDDPLMQSMIQGFGIIDVVNSYLEVALSSGMVGLALYGAIFVAVIADLRASMLRLPDQGGETALLGRCLLAALCGTLVTIATVSGITVIPIVYWTLAGLSVGYAQLCGLGARDVVPAATAFPPRRGPIEGI